MSDIIQEMAKRIRSLREMEDISQESMAARLNMPLEEYQSYEAGERDFSFSAMYNIANELGVDVVDIMTGDSPKLSSACMVRKGEGFKIDRRKAYDYRHLAFTFRNKKAEPFMVTVEPQADDTQPQLHAHEGQEFNYVVEGSLALYIGEVVYYLEAGDSLYFNSGIPHAMRALGGKRAQFLAVVMK